LSDALPAAAADDPPLGWSWFGRNVSSVLSLSSFPLLLSSLLFVPWFRSDEDEDDDVVFVDAIVRVITVKRVGCEYFPCCRPPDVQILGVVDEPRFVLGRISFLSPPPFVCFFSLQRSLQLA
jgi:hypothetical protein